MTRALVFHPEIKGNSSARLPENALGEAIRLTGAMPGVEVCDARVIRIARAHPAHLFGAGKVQEIKADIAAHSADLVIVDGHVTPIQQRNLEKEWNVKLLDRKSVILEIFADRARTSEGVLQVELAALSYQRSRLVRAWTHLDRQRGGFGFVGGPGETQLESDRRAIDDQIIRLKRQLSKVVKTRELHRAARAKVPFPVVALVGYTNAGKSTLFNRMTGADVLAQDMLFATLDPTMRGVMLPNGMKVIVSDTVGFISDLPPQLVAAFRATLEEVLSADLILHLRDIAHPESPAQAADVMKILGDLGVDPTVPILELWNKTDQLSPSALDALHSGTARRDVLAISALEGQGIDLLMTQISDVLGNAHMRAEISLQFHDGRRRAWLHDHAKVEAEQQHEAGWSLHVSWTAREKALFDRL